MTLFYKITQKNPTIMLYYITLMSYYLTLVQKRHIVAIVTSFDERDGKIYEFCTTRRYPR